MKMFDKSTGDMAQKVLDENINSNINSQNVINKILGNTDEEQDFSDDVDSDPDD